MLLHAVSDSNDFSRDLGQCSRCKGRLSRWDYGTDVLGRTVEDCPVCGKHPLPITRVAPAVRRRVAPNPVRCGKCADCNTDLIYRGTGGIPERCKDCQKERSRVRCLNREREKRAKWRKAMGIEEKPRQPFLDLSA